MLSRARYMTHKYPVDRVNAMVIDILHHLTTCIWICMCVCNSMPYHRSTMLSICIHYHECVLSRCITAVHCVITTHKEGASMVINTMVMIVICHYHYHYHTIHSASYHHIHIISHALHDHYYRIMDRHHIYSCNSRRQIQSNRIRVVCSLY